MTHRVSTAPASSPRAASSFSPASRSPRCGSGMTTPARRRRPRHGHVERRRRAGPRRWPGTARSARGDRDRRPHRGRRRGARGRRRAPRAHLDRQRLHRGQGLRHLRRETPQLLSRRDLRAVPEGPRGPHGRVPRRRGAPAEDAFGEGGNPQLASATRTASSSWSTCSPGSATSPRAEERDPRSGRPARRGPTASSRGLDFADANKPSKNLLDTTAHQGRRTGGRERPDHRGQLPRPGLRRRAPFDETYSRSPRRSRSASARS